MHGIRRGFTAQSAQRPAFYMQSGSSSELAQHPHFFLKGFPHGMGQHRANLSHFFVCCIVLGVRIIDGVMVMPAMVTATSFSEDQIYNRPSGFHLLESTAGALSLPVWSWRLRRVNDFPEVVLALYPHLS